MKSFSKIETELPVEIQTVIDQLLRENATYSQITKWLDDGGFSISRSCVSRYGKRFFEFKGNRIRLLDRLPDSKKERLYQLIEEIVTLFEE